MSTTLAPSLYGWGKQGTEMEKNGLGKHKAIITGASEISHLVKVLASRPVYLSSTPGTHTVKGENQHLRGVL